MLNNKMLVIAAAVAAFGVVGCAKKEAEAPAAATAAATTATAGGIEACVKTVLAKVPGEILQATLETQTEGKTWELEIKQADGKLMDIECSDTTGAIVEEETRVSSASDPAFSKAKVTEADATKTALEKAPGMVERVEYEIESDGKLTYEFDIKTASGDIRLEIDAESGAITENYSELLEIGHI